MKEEGAIEHDEVVGQAVFYDISTRADWLHFFSGSFLSILLHRVATAYPRL